MDTFKADYKGTCALCWCTVYPGDDLVRVKAEVLGDTFERNVHAECQRLFIESLPPEEARQETEAIIPIV